jgi:hypothetical protein
MRRLLPAVVVLPVLLAACSGGEGEAKQPEPSPLLGAYTTCREQLAADLAGLKTDDTADDYLIVDDAGQTLLVKTADSGGEIRAMLALRTASCVLDELEAPKTVLASMQSTTALSGTQEASWDGIKASWTYVGGTNAALTLNLGLA